MTQSILKTDSLGVVLASKAKIWLQAFIDESELFEQANSWDEFWRVYKEEPLLTLLATGLARMDIERRISILREYPVYSKGSFIGASDLFLNYHKENQHFYIEAKYERARWETGFIEWSEESRLGFLNEVMQQLNPYIEAEHDKLAESYIVILLFYIVDFKLEESYKKYIVAASRYIPPSNQFYCLLPAKNPNESPYKMFGVIEVIGHIQEVGKSPF